MEIIKLTIEDVERYNIDIRIMLKQSYEKSFPEKSFDAASYLIRVQSLKAYMGDGKAIVYGIKNKERLAGFVWFFEKDYQGYNLIHINHFVVHEDFRRVGVGKALWDAVEGYATKKGIDEIELLVTKNNKDAVNFYEKRNFQVDRLVMKKRL
ncbi:GNAT family N-acetyltransferase [Peribacillus butanolivorans]|uniref:GNAT family N-acetyltransferase n=1 Tax=Peribacillus butanolivorans TaxID=421767 RepID=UPI003D2CFF66